MDKKPTESAEALARKLQEKLRKERPSWQRWAWLTILVLLVVATVTTWLMLHNPDPNWTVTALDGLMVAGEPTLVQACFDLTDPEAKLVNPAGLRAVFWLGAAANPLDEKARRVGTSDASGQVVAKLELEKPTKTLFHVRYAAAPKKGEAIKESSAHVHVIAKDSSLLIVDVEETLADLDPKMWSKTNPLDIAVKPGAAKALQTAHAKLGFAIAYLAVAGNLAKEYPRVRGWVILKASGADALPDGPVLGRLRYDPINVSEARQAHLSDLRQRFTGTIAAVVRTSEAAEQCDALGIRAIAMGGGDFPAQVTRIKGWDELSAALAK